MLKLIHYWLLIGACKVSLSHYNDELNVFEDSTIKIPCSYSHSDNFKLFSPRSRPKRSSGFIYDYEEVNLWTYTSREPGTKEGLVAFNFVSKYGHDKIVEDQDLSIIGVGGDVVGAKCHFPFEFNSTVFNKTLTFFGCTRSGLGSCWCSPTKEVTKFMYCPCASNRPGFRVLTTAGGPQAQVGKFCQFPFDYEGQTYDSCIVGNKDKCWCITEGRALNSDESNWGYCPCATPTQEGNWAMWSAWSRCSCGGISYRYRLCDKPPKLRYLEAGQKLLCYGERFDVRFCACDRDRVRRFQLADLLSLRKRSVATGGGQAGELELKRLTVADSGIYSCVRATVERGWSLREENRNTLGRFRLNVVARPNLRMLAHHQPPHFPTGASSAWEIRWKWTPWQKCDRCGLVTGEQKRIGFCHIVEKKSGFASKTSPVACGSKEADWNELGLTRKQLVKGERPHDYVQVRPCQQNCLITPKYLRYPALKAASGDVDDVIDRSQLPPFTDKPNRVLRSVEVGGAVLLECSRAQPTLPVSWTFLPRDGAKDDPGLRLLRYPDPDGTGVGPEYSITALDQLRLVNLQVEHDGFYNCHVDIKLSDSFSVAVSEPPPSFLVLNIVIYACGSVLALTTLYYAIPPHLFTSLRGKYQLIRDHNKLLLPKLTDDEDDE